MNKADTERQQAVRENVTISYRGASYEIGRGPHFYGIWLVGAPQPQPVEWWPETPEGWSSAWARFTGIEAPGTIAAVRPAATGTTRPWTPPGQQGFAPGGPATQPAMAANMAPAMTPAMAPTPVGHPAALAAQPAPYPGQPAAYPAQPGDYPARPASAARAGLQAKAAAALLVVGVALGVGSLFPSYQFGTSLADQTPNLVPHVIYIAAWAGAALLILLGGARVRMGALLAAGTSIVTFGLFIADAGYGSSTWGTGLVLGLTGWLVCSLGALLAIRIRQGQAAGRPQAFAARHIMAVVAALASLGVAITFAPAWDGYTLRANGVSIYRTLGNAFASTNPGWVIFGDVLAMIAIVLAVVVAALWRPVREGAWLLAGAIIPMAAQAISALIQVGQPTSPALFGLPPAAASRLGLTITNSLTPAFWLFAAFLLVLMVGCGWLLLSARATALDTPGQRGQGPAGQGPGGWGYSWPHPFTGAPGGTPETTQTTQDAPQNPGLDILDSPDAEPDILDSAQGKVEPSTPDTGTPETSTAETSAWKPATPEPGTPEPGTPEPGTPEPGTPEPGSRP